MAKELFDLALEQLKQPAESLTVVDELKKEVLYLLAQCYERLDKQEDAIQQYKAIYSNDIGYRDVSQKINKFYGKKESTESITNPPSNP
jgi:tetratricopeptide (TPR) repeat protein